MKHPKAEVCPVCRGKLAIVMGRTYPICPAGHEWFRSASFSLATPQGQTTHNGRRKTWYTIDGVAGQFVLSDLTGPWIWARRRTKNREYLTRFAPLPDRPSPRHKPHPQTKLPAKSREQPKAADARMRLRGKVLGAMRRCKSQVTLNVKATTTPPKL